MNTKDHNHPHSAKHDHAHDHNKPGWKPHQDWRVIVAVVIMLAAIVVYVLTLDEAIQPGGVGPGVPAAPAPAVPVAP